MYSKEERPDYEDRSRLYGWSRSKSVVKAFMKQRSKDKYRVFKMNENEIARTFSEDIDDPEAMIDLIKLKSVKSGELIGIFMTSNEMLETEKKVQKLFYDQASLSNVEGDGNYVSMFLHIKDYYADALYIIGCRPGEIDAIYPSSDYHDDYANLMDIEEKIDNAYMGMYLCPQEVWQRSDTSLRGLSMIDDISNKILYSVESFIKVMREDM